MIYVISQVVLAGAMLNKNLFTSDKSDWETPDDLFHKLDGEFHFTLDVCASRHNKKVENFFSAAEDGLKQEWSGVCWMNPPYGREIRFWVEKAYNESSRATVVCLLPCRTDTKWWHQFVMKGEVRFLTRRPSFKGSSNKATFPACIVVFGRGARVGKLLAYSI